MDEHQRASTQFRFPVKFVGGKVTATGTSELARFNAQAIGKLFFDVTPAVGSYAARLKENYTVDAITHLVTVVPPAATTYYADLGICYAVGCVPLVLVPVSAGHPLQGEYTSSGTGIYTFNAADASAGVLVSYLYHSATVGKTVALTNTYQQLVTTFKVVLYGSYNGKQLVGVFNACISHQLSLALMLEDWTKANFKFEMQSDSSLNIGFISLSE